LREKLLSLLLRPQKEASKSSERYWVSEEIAVAKVEENASFEVRCTSVEHRTLRQQLTETFRKLRKKTMEAIDRKLFPLSVFHSKLIRIKHEVLEPDLEEVQRKSTKLD